LVNGLDVGFLVNYFKSPSAPPPPCLLCVAIPTFPCGADVNGNCALNGIDVTYLVNYLKGIGIAPATCAAC
jgi:hypothetical protein